MMSEEKKMYFYTEDLSVGYNGKPLISEIRMRVNRGEILTLIGPNGSGKSTILKSITRQLKTLGGTVVIDQKLLGQISNKELSQKLAVVLTERMRPELMTCEDIVATGRYPYTGTLGILNDEDRRKVHEAMEMVHAMDLCERDFLAISDGQRQRILLARAICQEPEIIVLDEPTSFLDIRHKMELLSILKKMVTERNVAVIMSLHELDLAQKISDFVICVHGSRIERAGTPEEIFTSENIHELYDISTGSYNANFGCIEMESVSGATEVFVIAGGGSGIPVFRRLQRMRIPFAAGVLHKGDVDHEAALALAGRVIEEQAFEPVSPEKFEEGLTCMKNCRYVINCLSDFGTMNQKNKELVTLAGELGKLITIEEFYHLQGDGK